MTTGSTSRRPQVTAELQRYAEGADKPHYLVSEIFLPVDNPDKDAEVLKDAQNRRGPAQDRARSFRHGRPSVQPESRPRRRAAISAGCYEGQLAPELNAALTKMAVNTVSPPIRSVGGYYILALRARQEPLGTKIDTTNGRRDQPRQHAAAGAPAAAAGRQHHQGDGGQRQQACRQYPRRLQRLRRAFQSAGKS